MTEDVNSTTTRVTILIVSDVHLKQDYLEHVKKYLTKQNLLGSIDVAICAGDFANLKGEEYTNDNVLKYTEGVIDSIMAELETISPHAFYIPGNHDPISLFEAQNFHKKAKTSKNLHSKLVEIAPKLCIAGFGGSVPAFLKENGKRRWEGYPYPTEESFQKVLEPFMKSVQEQIQEDKSSLILLTHIGPEDSDTVKFEEKVGGELVLSGSSTMKQIWRQPWAQEQVVINIHGHTHPGVGTVNFCKFSIFNPGSLKEGNFGLVHLEFDSTTQKWWVEERRVVHFNPPPAPTPVPSSASTTASAKDPTPKESTSDEPSSTNGNNKEQQQEEINTSTK